MPHYEVQVLETLGRPTFWTVETPDDEWYDVGHVFELEGRRLEVALLEDAGPPFDQRLICNPLG
jgi:hypothetical protein